MRKQQEKHADHNWLSLITQHGLFISEPVLQTEFPEGPEKVPEDKYRSFKKEWDIFSLSSLEEKKKRYIRWIDFVLEDLLGSASTLWSKQPHIPPDARHYLMEYDQELVPDRVLLGKGGKPVFLVKILPPGTRLEKPEREAGKWKASPYFKLSTLCMETKIPLGLLTNGDEFRILHVKPITGTSYFEWKALDWYDEKSLLDSFYTLLRRERFYGDEKQLLLKLIEDSQQRQLDVTDQLGEQMRNALCILVRAIGDLSLQNKNLRDVFKDASEEYLYEMCLTVVMRLVFILYSEENGLLPHGVYVYENNYGLSHLVYQLQSKANDEDYMNKKDAWPRILSLFRLIFDGCEHPDVNTIAYGSDLFDYNRFPQVEDPTLTLSNRTVYNILYYLCYAEAKIGKENVRQKVSYRTIDVEQIGSVYEGLIGYSIEKAQETLVVFKGNEEAVRPVSEFRDLSGEKLIEYIHILTGKTKESIKKIFDENTQQDNVRKLQDYLTTQCEEVRKIEKFIEMDQIVYKDQLYITRAGSIRKGSGTFYTPKEITRFLVQEVLESLVYKQNGEARLIKTPREILSLKICDPAMGSGAFLVQVIRYLSEKLVESWKKLASLYQDKILTIPFGEEGYGDDRDDVIPEDEDEALQRARLLVAQNCIYGVDLNHMAVELAKVSIWLTTMSKDKPLTFLDHRLKQGNSLIGSDLEHISFVPDEPLWKDFKKINKNVIKNSSLTGIDFAQYIVDVLKTRKKLQEQEITSDDIKRKAVLFCEEYKEDKPISKLKKVFDFWSSIWFWPFDETEKQLNKNNGSKTIEKKLFDFDNGGNSIVIKNDNIESKIKTDITNKKLETNNLLHPPHTGEYRDIALSYLGSKISVNEIKNLDEYSNIIKAALEQSHFFHWELEFPEIFFKDDGSFRENPGFDAVIGNPPWDKVKPNDLEFFSLFDPNFRSLPPEGQIIRRKELLVNQMISLKYNKYLKLITQTMKFFDESPIYKYQKAKVYGKEESGDKNLYKLFTERFITTVKMDGVTAIITPASVTTDIGCTGLRRMFFIKGTFKDIYTFYKRAKAFPIDQAVTLLIFKKTVKKENVFTCSDNIGFKEPGNLSVISQELLDRKNTYPKSNIDFFETLSPELLVFQAINDKKERIILEKLFRFPILRRWKTPPYNIKTGSETHLTQVKSFIRTSDTGIPLWRGDHISSYRIRYYPQEWIDPSYKKMKIEHHKSPRLGWQHTSADQGIRRLSATFIPSGGTIGNSIDYFDPTKSTLPLLMYICAILNSSIAEYRVRQTAKGSSVGQYVIKELPVPPLDLECELFNEIQNLTNELVGYIYEKSFIISPDKFESNWCKIDALIAIAYDLTESEFSFILNNIPLPRREEVANPEIKKREQSLKAYIEYSNRFKPLDAYRKIVNIKVEKIVDIEENNNEDESDA